MANELALRKEIDIDKIEKLAKHLALSGYFQDDKKGTPEQKASQMVVKILAGEALGLDPVASVTGLDVINEKVRLESNVMAALINRSQRHSYKIVDHDDDHCRIEFYRDDKLLGEGVFTMAHAKQADLLRKANWKSYPYDMLYNRAMSRGFRKFCPELGLGSNYTSDELEPFEPDLIIENNGPELLITSEAAKVVEVTETKPISQETQRVMVQTMLNSNPELKEKSPVEIAQFINEKIEESEAGQYEPVTVKEVINAMK